MNYKRGQFFINDHHSQEFNVFMRERPSSAAAGRVLELRERIGNDSIVIDSEYYRNTTKEVKCYIKAPSLELVQDYQDLVSAWLDMGDYGEFITYYDQQYIYQAIVTDGPVFSGTRKTGTIIPFEFTISLRPFKYNRIGQETIGYDGPFQLHNWEKYPSKPKIKLFGAGDASFFINDQEFIIEDLDQELIIDSQLEESYRYLNGALEPQDKKTKFLDFPLLYPGFNSIRWSNKITKFELTPRWWRKI